MGLISSATMDGSEEIKNTSMIKMQIIFFFWQIILRNPIYKPVLKQLYKGFTYLRRSDSFTKVPEQDSQYSSDVIFTSTQLKKKYPAI